MHARIPPCLVVLTCLVAALPASAQLTVATDKPEYIPGELVQITIHNAGPGVAVFSSEPPLAIWHLATGECCHGCTGLPVITTLAAGASRTFAFDPLGCPIGDPFGLYEVVVAGASPDPDPVLTTTFTVLDIVGAERLAWGWLKGLYR
jgi:hypothetical protein